MSFWRTSARADELAVDLDKIRALSDSEEDELQKEIKEKFDKMVKTNKIGPL